MAARSGGRSFYLAVSAIVTVLGGSLAAIFWLTGDGAPGAGSVAGLAPGRDAPRSEAPGPRVPEPVAPLAVVPPAASVPAAAPAEDRRPPPAAPRLQVSFKLDPRLTRGLHMGDRWVVPSTYSGTGDTRNATVEARVLDAAGKAMRGPVEWFASEPDMVDVDPPHGDRVRITVWREGESRLTVHGGGVSREVAVKAWRAGGALRVSLAPQ